MSKKTRQDTEPGITLQAISDLLDQKLEEKLEQKLDQKFDQFEIKLNKRFENIEAKLDRTINEVVDLKQDMVIVKDYLANEVPTKNEVNILVEGLATKADMWAIMDRLDRDVVKDQKFDQEQTMHSHRLREHTDQINKHTVEIKGLQVATA